MPLAAPFHLRRDRQFTCRAACHRLCQITRTHYVYVFWLDVKTPHTTVAGFQLGEDVLVELVKNLTGVGVHPRQEICLKEVP